jgi:phosphatidylglycerophosphate synthase
MSETKFGGMLDVFTDNVVHVAVFAGIFWGCYRSSGSSSYLYLIPVMLGGFALCGAAVYLALNIGEKGAEEWLGQIDRISGRDFAYLLVILALVNRLGFFAWGAAFGTYVFALVLIWATYRRWWRKPQDSYDDSSDPTIQPKSV